MHKIFTWIALFGLMLPLMGCEEYDYLLDPIVLDPVVAENNETDLSSKTPKNPNAWSSFTFKSLNGKEDLTVSKENTPENRVAITTSNYAEDFLAVAIYTTDCQACQLQAPYLDKIAEEFSASAYGINFAIVFLDIFEEGAQTQIPWITSLKHVDAYTNASADCKGGACKKMFANDKLETMAGNVYFINKKDLSQTAKSVIWNPHINPVENPQTLYEILRTQIADFLHLVPITFGATVEEPEPGPTLEFQ